MGKLEVYISISDLKNYMEGKKVFGEMVPQKRINAYCKLIIPIKEVFRTNEKTNTVCFVRVMTK